MRRIALAALVPAAVACSLARDSTDQHDMTALMRASREGNEGAVAALLAAGARVNQKVRGHSGVRVMLAFLAWMQQLPKRDAGYTALHYAAAGGNVGTARLLLDGGADVVAVAKAGETPLSLAARRGHGELVLLLLARGAPARSGDSAAAFESPVLAALFARDTGLVRLLLEAGADAEPPRGMPPLAVAARQGDTAVVAMLTARGADVNRAIGEGQTPLILAAQDGHVAVVRILLAAGADPSRRDRTANWTELEWAASRNHDSVVALLRRTDPARSGTRDIELVRAVQTRDVSRARELLAAGANPNTRTSSGGSLLSFAVYVQNVELARMLLQAGADWRVRERHEIPLVQAAAQRGNLEIVRLLLSAGATVRVPGTATYAASSGRVEMLRLVDSAGADVRESNDEPLRGAASAGNAEAVRYLLGRGALADAPDAQGRTALSRAVAFRQHEVVRVLLGAGASARQQSPGSGWTPLMNAAMAGDTLMVRILMDAGADPAVRDGEGKTAADYARGAGQHHVIPILERRR